MCSAYFVDEGVIKVGEYETLKEANRELLKKYSIDKIIQEIILKDENGKYVKFDDFYDVVK